MAMLLTGATVTAARAETLYQSLNIDLVLSYYQAAGTTDAHGTITYAAANRKITTAEFLQLMAGNLGITLNKGASLMRVTTLAEGTNIESFITNSTTLLPGNTALTNIEVPSTIVWTNFTGDTNYPALVTSNYTSPIDTPPVPASEYTPLSVTNFITYIIQGKVHRVVVGSSVQYYIINGSVLSDTNSWVLINQPHTNTTDAAATITALDEAQNFQDKHLYGPSYPIDATHGFTLGTNVYFGDKFLPSAGVNFYMAELVTNLNQNVFGPSGGYGPIFVGTVKTNLAMNATLYGDMIEVTLGSPDQPAGTSSFLANLSLIGTNATANTTTENVTFGSGHSKSTLPFSSWNTTFSVYGSGWLYGYDTNTFDTNYVYMDANYVADNDPEFITESPGFNSTNPTNPPVSITNSYTYETSSNAPDGQFIPFEFYEGPTYTKVQQVNQYTPDFTGYSFTYVTFIYTNISTNVYTLAPADTYYDTNFNVIDPLTTSFTMSGTVKVSFMKIGPP